MSSSIRTASLRNLLSKSISKSRKKRFNSENMNPNLQINDPPLSPSIPKPSTPSKSSTFSALDDSSRCGAPPPIQEEIVVRSDCPSEASVSEDAPVKVVVRIRPGNDVERMGDRTVRKLSSDSVSIGDRKFTFDSVLGSESVQEDVFQIVGIPLVKDALSGYNVSILSYGQTGSGKTYTMWGPPSAMVEDPSPSSQQGIVPRIFQMLFSEMQREQEKLEGKQINYQCRCSFVEIYNEQIGDLLHPVQRNLEIRDDPKNGFYVENLTEEYVTSYEDLTQILIKGLSNRKVGATSVNSKSSRSHVLFTFIIESWCKGSSPKCFSSSKISRINLVDLAGLDRNKLDDDAGRQFVREGKNVKKSLSHLGKLVNALAKGTQPGKIEEIPYKETCLTHLLQESLGGNAKLTVICSISPDNRNNSETLRTLRFGQRVKAITNEPVVNEISEDDVNDLSDQIRQLKEELIRAKCSINTSVGKTNGYFNGRSVRESLNHLRVSLNRSLMLPSIDNDSDNEMNVSEDDVREIHQQLDKMHSSCENSRDLSDNRDSAHFTSVEESFETDLMSEDEVNCPSDLSLVKHEDIVALQDDLEFNSRDIDHAPKNGISISLCHQSSLLQEPTLSESPKIGKTRKSMAIASLSASQNASGSSNFKLGALRHSLKQSEHLQSSLRSSKILRGSTESLAASLQRGLQIIDHHQQNSVDNRSSVSFSFEHLALKSCAELDGDNASVQKLAEERPCLDEPLLCASCQQKIHDNNNEVQGSLKTWIVSVDESGKPVQLAKDKGIDLAEARKKEKELEIVCMEQAAKIEQLNQLLEQYNHQSEYGQEGSSLHPKVLIKIEEKCEIKEVQEVLDHGNSYFDENEKEALLTEIQNLKNKLQSYTDATANKSTEKLRSSLMVQSIQLRKSMDLRGISEEELERERQRWTEKESDWISITDDLRIDLESNRRRAENVEMELKMEKQCTEELDDALHRAILGHARMVEHYAELQEKYNDLVGKHRAIMEGIAEVKKAAAKAGTKGGARFAKSLAAQLSTMRIEREKEREFLKKENKSLKIQLRDTAEAVHAAGELLVRLREAEQAASVAEENFANVQQDNDKLKKQIEKLKRKHKMEMITMKQYLAESKLPESALQPLYRENSDVAHNTIPNDDQAWRAEFGAIYQEHF